MTTLLAIAIAATPLLGMLLGVAGLLWLAGWIQQRRDGRYARQIALTDAIHRELGAVVAPMVRRRLWGGWRVSMMAPLDRPATVAVILRVTDEMFGSRGDVAKALYEIVLTRQPIRPGSQSTSARRAGVETPVRVAA